MYVWSKHQVGRRHSKKEIALFSYVLRACQILSSVRYQTDLIARNIAMYKIVLLLINNIDELQWTKIFLPTQSILSLAATAVELLSVKINQFIKSRIESIYYWKNFKLMQFLSPHKKFNIASNQLRIEGIHYSRIFVVFLVHMTPQGKKLTHNISSAYCSKIHNQVITTTACYHCRLAIEIEKHNDNFNRKDGYLKLSRTRFSITTTSSVKLY